VWVGVFVCVPVYKCVCVQARVHVCAHVHFVCAVPPVQPPLGVNLTSPSACTAVG
jgi:hypothetical protein